MGWMGDEGSEVQGQYAGGTVIKGLVYVSGSVTTHIGVTVEGVIVAATR